MLRRILIGISVVVVFIAGWFVWLLDTAGEFKTLTPHFDGTCKEVDGVIGPEDLTIHPRTGVAYISAYDRRLRDVPAKGAIYRYDLNDPAATPVNVTPDADPDFRPHGISLAVAPDGSSQLFVINHAGDRHAIEVFDVDDTRLVHRRTVTDPLLVSPNDLVAVGSTEVYVTNDHRHQSGIMRTLEDYLRLPLANVVRWDGQSFRAVAEGIRIANGINASTDGGTVFVASVTGKSIRRYHRDAASGALTLRDEIPVDSGPDNIEVAADGSLWIGAHPKVLTLVRHFSGGAEHAPAQALHVDNSGHVDEVYLNLGEQLSAASVAAVHGKRLLIGAILDPKFLDCTMR